MGRTIHILCRDGSPLGVSEESIHGKDGRMGVGGSELALLTMCAAWQYYGNDVTLYNDPKEAGKSSFRQLPVDAFDPNEDRDILINFRSPNPKTGASKGKKIWWSCDSHTIDDYRAFRSQVDKVVCISPHHAKYFREMYGIDDAVSIDLPVRVWEYPKNSGKRPKRCIFTSMPDRGLIQLSKVWPRIVSEVPDAELVITSDWRLWTEQASENWTRDYKLAFAPQPKIIYLGAVKREELVTIQSSADLHIYPCTFEEQFCIAVAESQVAGAFPVTNDIGALSTTNMGRVIHGNANDPAWQDVFVKNVLELLTDPKLSQKQEWVSEVARKRFSIEKILGKWEEVFS